MADEMTFQTTSLGLYTFQHNPQLPTDLVRKIRTIASIDTWSSAAVKDWGFKTQAQGLIGRSIKLRWVIMGRTFWDTLRGYNESIEPITWDPKGRARIPNEKYIVRIDDFSHSMTHRVADYAMGVEMTLNIRAIA